MIPTVPPFADDDPADPDRAWAFRDCGDGAEDASDEYDWTGTTCDPGDAPIDTDASWAAYQAWERRGSP